MNILFYGYGNHAKKLKNIANKFLESEEIEFNFFAIKRNPIQSTDVKIYGCIEECIINQNKIDAAFITLPDELHLSAFKECIRMQIPFIYVEKPAIGIEEHLNEIKKSKNSFLKFVQIGYQLRYSTPFIELRNMLDKNQIGQPLHFYSFTGKGLAFKPSYSDDWRSHKKLQIAKTLSCHQVNLVKYLFNELNPYYGNLLFTGEVKQSNLNGFWDTAVIHFKSSISNFSGTLVSSWGSALHTSFSLISTESKWAYDYKNISIAQNCLSFDQNNYQINVEPSVYKHENNGIKTSIESFIKKAVSNQAYEHETNDSSETYSVISTLGIS